MRWFKTGGFSMHERGAFDHVASDRGHLIDTHPSDSRVLVLLLDGRVVGEFRSVFDAKRAAEAALEAAR
jgi:hypothetical protein